MARLRFTAPGLAALFVLLIASGASAQQIKPRFMLLLDNSGSMRDSNLGATSCAGYDTNKMGHAKCAVRNMLDSAGDAEFGLMRFKLDAGSCDAQCDDDWKNNETLCEGEIVEAISADNSDSRVWVDMPLGGTCGGTTCTSPNELQQEELYAATRTPLYQSVQLIESYFTDTTVGPYTATGWTAPTETDDAAACRPLSVIILTDGAQSNTSNCDNPNNGNDLEPEDAVASLRTIDVPVPGGGTITKTINTYVIGFGVSNPSTQIEAMALAGGTSAFYANDQDELSAALQQIIFDAQLVEVCDGLDNDCDGEIDELLDLWCDEAGQRSGSSQTQLETRYTEEVRLGGMPGTAPAMSTDAETNVWLCDEPGELCNGQDDDCDNIIDEDASGGMETCDGTDEDCDGIIDEGLVCNCAPSESCNGIDDDCDVMTDDTDLTRVCGTNEGVCMTGIETCQDLGMGTWGYGGCTATVGDLVETCDGLDNDCDGIIDGFTESCGVSDVGECVFGQRLCTNNVWGSCVGDVGPELEICDGLDNDCDGAPDEDDMDGVSANDPRMSVDCGTDQGDCTFGSTICMNGGIVCWGEGFGGPETCDGDDNDCDGLIDDGNPDGGMTCGSSSTGQCQLGTEQCVNGGLQCVGNIEPGDFSETCDNVDNDCDGPIDEGVSRVCGTDEGECVVGTQDCSMGVFGVCSEDEDGTQELCDGDDNDCDGKIDEDPTDLAGSCGNGAGECQLGFEICVNGSPICAGDIGPVAEVCDNNDNDCDGTTDEDVTPRVCGTTLGECILGTEACSMGTWGTCTEDPSGTSESCDGLDNDCDGSFDEGSLPGIGGSCGGSMGQCTAGTTQCVAGSATCVGEGQPSTETCDNTDEDCDGPVDEDVTQDCGSAVGECTVGVRTCAAGVFGLCSGDAAITELCDGLDNDCDGLSDEANPESGSSCNSNVGACVSGTEACQGGMLVCTGFTGPVDEVCDDADNDCDGFTDETLARACGTDVGECAVGSQTCAMGAWGTCSDTGTMLESCDGLDNDCDGSIDEGNPGSGAGCGATDVGACDFGTINCIGGAPTCTGEIVAGQEACDNIDNDCDGSTDENVTAVCGIDVGECDPGLRTCTAGVFGACSEDEDGVSELCDGLDNDCDGLSDEGNPDSGGSCNSSVGECNSGTLNCIGGAPTCTGFDGPTAEICDNLDNDCDGTIDNNVPLRACGSVVGACMLGTQACSAGSWGSCSEDPNGTIETCDGLDNDCDGSTDEGNPGAGVQCGASDVGACAFGSTACVSGQIACQNEIVSVGETCNDDDDDCDGTTDEGLTQACGNDIGECVSGSESCSMGAWVGCSAVDPAGEACDGLDNDCDGLSDEGNPDAGGDCGATDVGECDWGVEICLGGALACRDEVIAVAENCDNLDNDCDGTTDEGLLRACGSQVGECTVGDQACAAGIWGLCDGVAPGNELCDGLDNDCDGRIDEGNPGGGIQCGVSDLGECDFGVTRCVNGGLACEGEITPAEEICDTRDNDCDGNFDEADPQLNTPCGIETGECALGSTICTGGVIGCDGDIGPIGEGCDALDNDCDGKVDENNPDGGGLCGDLGACRRAADPADVNAPLDLPCGECKFGQEQCEAGALVCRGAVEPSDELCDGLDNDCDYPCQVDVGGRPTDNCPADPCGLDPNDPGFVDCDVLVDEGVSNTDPNIGVECGIDIGECTAGAQDCVAGALICVGGQGPSVEICDGLDNDCDGDPDDGIPINQPCGLGGEVGECQTGLLVCIGSELVCEGSFDPLDEVCDGLDNDCDGRTDEGIVLGGVCGSDEGVCETGSISCIGGEETCVDSVTPGLEVCDCEDNDCDGEVDEGSDADKCPGGATCVMCQCALGCRDLGEFGLECPEGKAAVQEGGECFCVGELCNDLECRNQTVEVDGDVKCAPESDSVTACLCKQNECTHPCNGVVCEAGLVCDPTDAGCKEPTCLLPQFRCDDAEFCDPITGGCESDPCADAGCAEGEACRDGNCYASCSDVTCEVGDFCVDGECEADLCAAITCSAAEVCDPVEGECVSEGVCVDTGCAAGYVCNPVAGDCEVDPCLRTSCPGGQVCVNAQCQERCGADQVECNEVCIDPRRSLQYCGASGDCTGDDSGSTCADGKVCSGGECGDTCADGELNCAGACTDPATDPNFCGASGNCGGIEAGQRCAPGAPCVDGECQAVNAGPGGTTNVDGTAGDEEKDTYVTATGGGGCACHVTPGSDPRGGNSGHLWLLAGLGLLVAGRRRRALGRRELSLLVAAAAVLLSTLAGGCKTDAFCVDCTSGDGAVVSKDDGAGYGNISGGADGSVDVIGNDPGNDTGDGAMPDGGPTDVGNPECLDKELCNLVDDDCDGTIDEDADTSDVDLDTDVIHCGACGQKCSVPQAFPACVGGECVVMGCDVGWHDLSPDDPGCEYQCSATADDDSQCDLRDNDCDGKTDEDFDFQTDPENCNGCFIRCSFPHADGGACVDGVCELDSDACDANFYDINGEDDDGCEYSCTPAQDGLELCNAKDDDCDGTIDEGGEVSANDVRVDIPCGTDEGECVAGINRCIDGAVQCQGSVGVTAEVCDGLDNNCDGAVDESDPNIGLLCGNGIGECVRGTRQCMDDGQGGATLVCVGATPPVSEVCDGQDNDCDGNFDEGNPEGGVACGLQPGELQGTCVPGATLCAGGVLACPGLIGPVDELCDGFDNDCDGSVDEGNPESGASCGSAIGECAQGTQECMGGALVCEGATLPVDETCNGFDDDCDGVIDNGVGNTDPAINQACAGDLVAQDTGECAFGVTICESGTVQCNNYLGPVAERCDSLDNDCDGTTDEADPMLGDNCGVNRGECEFGTLQCNAGTLSCQGGTGAVPETCDGLDNNCDGAVDNGVVVSNDPRIDQNCSTDPADDTGACAWGTSVCAGGQIQCSGYTGPGLEICDDLDNDCDGSTDESFPQQGDDCGSDIGLCSFGGLVCVGGVQSCSGQQVSVDELCDGEDNDCDGLVDEEVAISDSAIGQNCADDVIAQDTGECAFGTTTCSGGAVTCSNYVGPAAETCDGDDNDCDGTTDEADPQLGNGCGSQVGECTQGAFVCNSGSLVCSGGAQPTSELCDGEDDDCDGLVDEDVTPLTDLALGQDCADDPIAQDTGDCDFGTTICSAGSVQCSGYLGPAGETCDGADNDCDGSADESFPESGNPCGSDIGLCSQGGIICNAGALTCSGQVDAAPFELCDNQDNDCDGLVDEGADATDPEVGDTCFSDPAQDTGSCDFGTKICTGGAIQCSGYVGPATEVCDGEDNDCNGVVDDNPTGEGATCGSDIGICQTGSLDCQSGSMVCVGQITAQPTELCDGADNDCNGLVDDGVAVSDPAVDVTCYADPVAMATGACTAGTTVCVGGSVQCNGSIGPELTESCDNIDNDCDGPVDEGNPDGGGACGSAVGECMEGAFQCTGGTLVCTGAVGPTDETCDGEDDDCNGLADDNIDPGDDNSIDVICGDADGVCGLQRGRTQCLGGVAACVGDAQPIAEVCDNLDNDCDGSVDEGNPGGGQLCGENKGECAFGIRTCNAGSYSCVGEVTGSDETCDGEDDDCDGNTDENIDPNDDNTIGAVCGDPDGICGLVSGLTVCVGGVAQCQGDQLPELELCDGADNDCDGAVDEGTDVTNNDVRVGQACGQDQGACQQGMNICSGGGIVCSMATGPTDETCNSTDDDCDGSIDENIDPMDDPSIGQSCGDPDGVCGASPGTTVCAGGSAACQGDTKPSLESCNSADDDCDGNVDEDFDTDTDVNHCNGCNMACPAVDHAIVECVGGTCGIRNCEAGYTDKDDPMDGSDDGPDCDYLCTVTGAEICDGVDNDCDWDADEDVDENPPSGFCNPNGVCSSGTVVCGGVMGWGCDVNPTTEGCNYADDDCDGSVDEDFANVGDVCWSHPDGATFACAVEGELRCNPLDDSEAPACRDPNDDSLVVDDMGLASAEVCNGLNDDCDLGVDEPCLNPGETSESGSDLDLQDSCVQDSWAELESGTWVFSYEASRPDATDSSLGLFTNRACSRTGVTPWVNVTYPEAEAACAALGADLCTEAEWYEACSYNTVSNTADYCEWSFENLVCTDTDYGANKCNGADNGAGDILSTGAMSSCYRTHENGRDVYDLSGNVKEWTKERSGDLRPLRGGAMNNTANGISCGFDFTLVEEPADPADEPFFFNIGFRCCYN